MSSLAALLSEVRACSLCAEHLPLGPRPVVQVHSSARVLIAAQAPGRKVHSSGLPVPSCQTVLLSCRPPISRFKGFCGSSDTL